MRNLLLYVFAVLGLVCIQSSDVVARTPKCGEIARRDIKDVFSRAKDIKYYHDITEDLNNTCRTLEAFENWEDGQDKSKVSNKVFKKSKSGIISDIEHRFTILLRPLIIIDTWFKADTNNVTERVKRLANIREAKKDIEDIQVDLSKLRSDLRKLMY
ncbi:MAG: hypothetical protein ACRBB3_09125 [Alphaproteobacteria bacterium]